MSTTRKWALMKVKQTEQASDIILKDQLFQAFKSDNPTIPRDRFFSEFGRLLKRAPFNHVVPVRKRRTNLGFRYLAFKNVEKAEKNSSISVPFKKGQFSATNERKFCHSVANVVAEIDETNKKDDINGRPQCKKEKQSNSNSMNGNSGVGIVEKSVATKEIGGGRSFQCDSKIIIDKTESSQGVADVVVISEDYEEGSNEPKNKKSKLISSNPQKGNSGVENVNINLNVSNEIGDERPYEYDSGIIVDTKESWQNAFDLSDAESVGHSGLGSIYSVNSGFDVDEDDDMTAVSETSWNDPSDIEDDKLVNDLKGASFRRKDCESMYFKPSIFFGYWKNVKAFTSAKLPKCYQNHNSHLDQQFPKSSFQQRPSLLNSIGSVNNVSLTQLHSFLTASFLPVPIGPKARTFVGLLSVGSLFPQFSAASASKSKFECEICIPYKKWAQENNVSCASLKSKTATNEQIAKGTAYLMFSGFRQLYEHAISKCHREAIDFFDDKSVESTIPEGENLEQDKEEKPRKVQSSLHFFFRNTHSLN